MHSTGIVWPAVTASNWLCLSCQHVLSFGPLGQSVSQTRCVCHELVVGSWFELKQYFCSI